MDQVNELIIQYGLALIFINVLLDQLGIPIPAIPGLIVAGAFAADGRLCAPEIFAVAVAATLIADTAWYLAGRHYGDRVLRALCVVSLTPDMCVRQTHAFFERWGVKALPIAKFVPGLAAIVPPLAGAAKVGWIRFALFSALGAGLWVGAGMGIGLVLKDQIEGIFGLLQSTGSATVTALGALCIGYLAYKWLERNRFFKALRLARISVGELHGLIEDGTAPPVFDVRSQSARALDPKRIPGALHVPLRAIDWHAREMPRDRDIILYCTCPSEVSAAEAARLLMNSGFKRVRPLHGGLDAWIAAGYPVESID